MKFQMFKSIYDSCRGHNDVDACKKKCEMDKKDLENRIKFIKENLKTHIATFPHRTGGTFVKKWRLKLKRINEKYASMDC